MPSQGINPFELPASDRLLPPLTNREPPVFTVIEQFTNTCPVVCCESITSESYQTRIMKQTIAVIAILSGLSTLYAQEHSHSDAHSRAVIFPDIPGFITMKADLHIHTVFSDGNVWPTIRVKEAVRDSLDVIAITDHIEYLPHEQDIPPVNRNRSYEVALGAASSSGILLVKGTELTRELPPGHSNAIFLDDVNPFVLDDPLAQFEEAKRQGAFVFWNHPSWEGQQTNTIAKATEMHERLFIDGLVHGIEVVNGQMYSEEALQIALDHNLTIMGTSDVHDLVDWDYDVENGGHRPATLVFTTERSLDGLKEALFERRTVVYYKDFLIGREEYLRPLLKEIIQVKEAQYVPGKEILGVVLSNNSSANLILVNRSPFGMHTDSDIIVLPHHSDTRIVVQTVEILEQVELEFEVLSAISAPRTHPVVGISVVVE